MSAIGRAARSAGFIVLVMLVLILLASCGCWLGARFLMAVHYAVWAQFSLAVLAVFILLFVVFLAVETV